MCPMLSNAFLSRQVLMHFPKLSIETCIQLIKSRLTHYRALACLVCRLDILPTLAMVASNLLTGGSYSVTFFSDSRLEMLSVKLQNTKVDDLIRRISSIINNKVKPTSSTSTVHLLERDPPPLDHATATNYIITYYEQVHPIFPHLDRSSFDSTVSSGNLNNILVTDPAFSALYHSVLALGCLHDGGGSFEPGKGKAWELFSVALAQLPSLPRSANSLVALQAMTTAAVYALGIPCLSIEERILTDTARMAQDLAPILSKGPSAKIYHRIFWVIYALEKTSSFHFGRSSAINDANIVVPIPHIPESNFGSFNWVVTISRQCRLLSRAMNTLFCPGVCQKGTHYFVTTIAELQQDLEQWRLSIPHDLRPGPSCQCHTLRRPLKGSMGIWLNYLYYSLRLILLRSRLQINDPADNDLTRGEFRDQLVAVSRSILEMVTYVDVAPSTPLWILAGIPLCALFVLFDQVISNPRSPDTRSNLALLDIAGGHFGRIDFTSGGSLPGSLISEFTYIAREYINQLATYDLLQGPQSSFQLLNQASRPLATEPISVSSVSSQSNGQKMGSITPLISPPIIPNSNSLFSPTYAPIETLWDNGNDPLFGIDVMDIFNSIM
ncbi:hypothetical protein BKA59DRAFT_277275 [Fusarium tricinctum]|uniref:Xylanolytic transcriptional activator regulatory domain-containing protein n=1 Tax=Fusarium tricinctum TaxID=61284 RepID=A0A8K0RVX3_9HYPO|nr:hypothetical protein BKA59DRAFT_277275 [Fusarium tricinctum]